VRVLVENDLRDGLFERQLRLSEVEVRDVADGLERGGHVDRGREQRAQDLGAREEVVSEHHLEMACDVYGFASRES